MQDDTFWGHLEDLRSTLVKIFYIILLSSALSFLFYDSILQFLAGPIESVLQEPSRHASLETQAFDSFLLRNTSSTALPYTLPQGAEEVGRVGSSGNTLAPGESIEYRLPRRQVQLIALSPMEGMVAAVKMSFWVGLVGSSPAWLFLIYRFAHAGLKRRERKVLFPFLTLAIAFLALGLAFAYTLSLPIANQFLFSFNANLGQNAWSIGNYFDYTVILLLATGLVFESFVLLSILVHFELLTISTLRKRRPYVVIGFFVLAAILTPPDVVTQCLLAIPMVLLYEMAIFYGWIREKIKLPS